MPRRGTGSIYPRKDGYWVAQLEHHGQRRYIYGKSRAEVEAKLFQGLPARPTPSPIVPGSVAEFMAEWLDVMRPPRYAPKTHAGYVAIARNVIGPTLGHIELSSLGRQDVEQAITTWSAQRHPQTVEHYLTCLQAALTAAVEWGRIAVSPAARMTRKLPRVPASEIRALTEAEEAKLLEFTADDPEALLYRMALRTGMRQGELLGMLWSDWDSAKRTIHVRHTVVRLHGRSLPSETPKTKASRRDIPVSEDIARALDAHRKKQLATEGRTEQGLVFTAPLGSPLIGTDVTLHFQRRCREAGLGHRTFHELRHTFATRLLERGVRIDVVQKLLGHSSITTTIAVYGHVTEDAKRSAIEALG